MQIRSDYNTRSGAGYQNSHTHHITKCLHEEGQKKQDAAAGGIKSDAAVSEHEKGTFSEGNAYIYGENRTETINEPRKKSSVIRELWDALGDDKPGETDSARDEAAKAAGVNLILSAVRQAFSHNVVSRWENIREKIKVGVGVALKRFKKENDDFSALSDPKGNLNRKKSREGRLSGKAGKGTRREEAEIVTAAQANSHLMDSYNKSGEYCQINENLTYRKKV